MLISLALILLRVFSTSADDEFPVISGYYLTDLYPWDENSFQSMALLWTIGSGDTPTAYSVCDGFPYLGGVGILNPGTPLVRSYEPLPSHNMIYFHFQLFLINSWTATAQIAIMFDDDIVYEFYPALYLNDVGQTKCGEVAVTDFYVIGRYFHNSDTLSVRYISTKKDLACVTDCSYGIRQVQMRFTGSIETNHSCAISNSISSLYGACDCGNQSVIPITPSPGMSCQRCHDSCDQCYGLTDQDCIGCASGFFYDRSNNKCAPCASNCLICSGSSPSECALCKPNLFQYPNNTCSSTCGRGLVLAKDGVYKKCGLTCDLEFYVVTSNSCVSSCLAPSIESNDGDKGISYCDLSISCEYPYRSDESGLCIIDLSKDEEKKLKNIFTAIDLATSVASSLATLVSLINFSNPTALFSAIFVDLQRYYKYMKIKYPPKLLYYMELEVNFSILNFLDPPENLVNSITKGNISESFDKGDFHSSFLINFWRPLMVLLITICGLLLVLLLEPWTKKYEKLNSLFVAMKHALKWNFPLTLFNSYFGEIILYTSFEFRTADPSSILPILSFMLCCLLNLFALIVYCNMVYIIRNYWKTKNPANSLAEANSPPKVLRDYLVLIEAFKDKSFFQLLFICFYVGRVTLFLGLIAYLFEHSLPQSCLNLLLSCSMFIYLAIKRPLKNLLDLTNYIIQESIMLVEAVCLLGLSILDYINSQDNSTREVFGDIIIYSNTVFGSSTILYVTVQVLILLKKAYTVIKKIRIRKKSQAPPHDNKALEKNDSLGQQSQQTILPPLGNVRISKWPKNNPKLRPVRLSSTFQSISIVSQGESRADASQLSIHKQENHDELSS